MKQKKEKGSIVLFVTISCLFILIIVSIAYLNIQDRKREQDRQIDDIVDGYSVTYADMEKKYYEIIGNNNEPVNTPITSVEQLKCGNYVKYVNADKKGEICVVLYESGDTENVQIMQLSLVPIFDKGWEGNNSWNGALTNLSDTAYRYINREYSDRARIVGEPKNFTRLSEQDKFSAWKREEYASFYRGYDGSWDEFYGDSNGSIYEDLEAMGNEKKAENKYLCMTREIIGNDGESRLGRFYTLNFLVGVINTDGNHENISLATMRNGISLSGSELKWNDGITINYDTYKNVKTRVIYELNSNILIIGGKGTKGDPYILGLSS